VTRPDVSAPLRAWLAARLEAPDLELAELRRHTEGFSWETYTLLARWTAVDGTACARGFAVRVEPVDGVNAPYDVEEQYRLHRQLRDATEIPLPEVHWLERDPTVLGTPFYVMERVPGAVPVPWDRDVFASEAARRSIGLEFVDIQAQIHRVDWRAAGLERLAAGDDARACAIAEVERWSDYYSAAVLVDVPLLRLAIAWLRANPAWTDRMVLVHGDYRIGNFIVDGGTITCVLDWEYAHVGDPLQDLAFTNLRMFRGRSPLVCGLLAAEEYFARYTERTGIAVDPDVLRFWTVVALLRAAAVYVRGCSVFEAGRTADLRLARMGHRLQYLLREIAREIGVT
jgi:aminoglycoside phosphotransferase (APT) family kinase protein